MDENMKLAEALTIRADLQKRILQLQERLKSNSKVQEGDKPAEDPQALLKELDECTDQLEKLITAINLTNCRTMQDGSTITALIAQRDVLAMKNEILRDFLKSASEKVDRYSKAEIRIDSTINVVQMQKTVDENSKKLRETNLKIQELNWTTNLME